MAIEINLKRSIMTNVAYNNSSKVIITTDNPRSEKPEDIFYDMQSGLNLNQKNKILFLTESRLSGLLLS